MVSGLRVRIAELAICVLVIFSVPVMAGGSEETSTRTFDAEHSSVTTELQNSFSDPVLIRALQTGADGRVVLVGSGARAVGRERYSGPIWILFFDSSRTLMDAETGSITTSPYNIYVDGIHTAISTSAPQLSIEAQVLVSADGLDELRVFRTGLRFLFDFIVHNGSLYVSTEKTSANIRRFDLETGVEFRYEGFPAQNAAFTLEDGDLFAVADSMAFLLQEVQFLQVSDSSLQRTMSTRLFSVHSDQNEYVQYESWDDLIESAPL